MIEILIAALIVGLILFVAMIIGTVLGTFGGWILSLTFLGNWIIEGFQVFGIDADGKLTVIGAMLGFISGFIRSSMELNGSWNST